MTTTDTAAALFSSGPQARYSRNTSGSGFKSTDIQKKGSQQAWMENEDLSN